ncbi:hypothetical protein AAG565_14730 [Fontimonas sp. SYSU GA230001]|uniref:hypothetical protein n=1 Tax=Fontimonas sp. SYSU GA230001 TaxID=3142450 RepID=UPI0032B47573
MNKNWRGAWTLVGLTAAGAAPAQTGDLNYQLHGFASQAYAQSWGNNYVGDSLDGSFAFYELGLNATAGGGPVTVSAQALYRRFGDLDREGARLDYAFADYRFLSALDAHAGVRLGRVKNPYGFFNDSRDVVFTRPGILLPGSVYFEGSGVRSLLFSSDGGQLYGGWNAGDHFLSLTAGRALNFTASDDQKRSLFGSEGFSGDVDIDGLTVVRLLDEWAAGTWRAALTYTSAELSFDGEQQVAPGFSVPISGTFDTDLYIASIAYNAERYSLTAEYLLTRFKGRFNGDTDRNSGDGVYVQADYRFLPGWTGMLRYDLSFSDRNDRSGRDYARSTGGDRHERFARDLTAGLKWLPDEHWGVWVEQHFIVGSATVPRLENQDRRIESTGQLFLVMVGYHF